MLKKIVLKSENKFIPSQDQKITRVLKKHKKGLSVYLISYYTGIKSGGSLTNKIKDMTREGAIEKVTCPHCESTNVYRLVK